jgi:DNA adenine methylase
MTTNSFPLTITPLRYPGGKLWFYPRADQFFGSHRPSLLIEPFAGGATVGVSLLANNRCDRLLLVEKDPNVAAFWRTALRSDRLASMVARFKPTKRNVEWIRRGKPRNDLNVAFWTYITNRTSFGGNIYGGMSSPEHYRWKSSPIDLYQIRALASRIKFIEGDALEVLRAHNEPVNGCFADPPYVEKGKLLYAEHQFEPEQLFQALSTWDGRWLVTYDDHPLVHELAEKFGFQIERISTQGNQHRPSREVIITDE